MFENGYDNHPLTSEPNVTPAQLLLYGMAKYQGEWNTQKKRICHHLALIMMGLSLLMSMIGTLGMIFQFKYLKFYAH